MRHETPLGIPPVPLCAATVPHLTLPGIYGIGQMARWHAVFDTQRER